MITEPFPKLNRQKGAPAIAIVAALALAVELEHTKDGWCPYYYLSFPTRSRFEADFEYLGAQSKQELVEFIYSRLDYLKESRPTAVDLSNAIKLLKTKTNEASSKATTTDETQVCASIRDAYILVAEKILEDDHATNKAIGRYGAEYLRRLQSPLSTSVDPADELRYYTTSPPHTQGAPDQTYRKFSVLTHCNTG